MTPPSLPQGRTDFKVAIICALPLEAEYVLSVFDKCWDDEGKQFGKADGDKNAYTTGVIGKHNVVLVHMPNIGGVSASAVAANVTSSFPAIQLGLVVGICGAVPVQPKTKEEIILGDIIISTHVIQYDFGRQYPDGFERKKEIEDSLARANREIRAVTAKLETRQHRKRLKNQLKDHLCQIQREAPEATYPGAAQDRLYKASYVHEHRSERNSCEQCKDTIATCPKSCDELGCEKDQLVVRRRLSPLEPSSIDLETAHVPSVYFGRFGSANSVMKSAIHRDKIAKEDGVIAFEMEGAGVWDELPTVVIKAACDYADSHKNKKWQEYAAATAAACMKAFLREWVTSDQVLDQGLLDHLLIRIHCGVCSWSLGKPPKSVFHVPFDRGQGFVGRTDELKILKQKVSQPDSRRVVSVLGLGGVGKSRLALELAYQIQLEQPEHSIIWVQATDQLTFEKNMLEIGKKFKIPGIEDEKADVKELVKHHLSDSAVGEWLMILDNADDEDIWGRQSPSNDPESRLVDFLPRTASGSILITTRTRLVATYLAGKEVIELKAMSSGEASQMLTDGLERPEMTADHDITLKLLDTLACLPLAIAQPAAYMNMTQQPVRTYLQLLDEAETDVIELLSEDFGDPSRYPGAKNPVATTWLISFELIKKRHELAAKYLSTMACLHEKNIPLSLLPEASSKKKELDAISVLKGYSFLTEQTRGSGSDNREILYDMHRLVHLATRNWLKNDGLLNGMVKDCLTRVARLFPAPLLEHRDMWRLYIPHCQRICEGSTVEDITERYYLLEKMGLCFVVDGHYKDAVRMHTAVVTWRERNTGTSDEGELQVLQAYNNLGTALTFQGDYPEAEKYLQQAFEMRRNLLGQHHPDTLISQANLALTYWHQGRCNEAEELEVQVMEMRKRVLGQEHPATLFSHANLAFTYANQGRWKEAEELFIQVEEMRKRVLGQHHSETSTNQANRAFTYWDQDRQSAALDLMRKFAESFLSKLGAEHPDTRKGIATLKEWEEELGHNTAI